MSGHSGFIAIGGAHQPNVVVNANPIGNDVNIAENNVQNAEPAADYHAVAKESFKSASLVKELDILLAKAASTARVGVSGADLAKTAIKAKLSEETAESIKNAAIAAKNAMRKLDSFTGAELAKAMVKTEDGNIDWDVQNPAGSAVQKAMDAQEKLSELLNKTINNLPKKASAETRAVLEEAMLQADRRQGEIETIVMQITEIAEIGIDSGKVDFETEERLNRKVGELAGEKALAMHDNDRALKSVKDNIAPLIARLDAYSSNVAAGVSSRELKTFIREIAEAKNAIANAAKTGVVKVPNASGAMVDVFVDRTFLDAASKIVDEAARRLGNLRESIGKETVMKFIANDMPWLKEPILQPKFALLLESLAPGRLDTLAGLTDGLGLLRKAMEEMAQSPSQERSQRLRNLGAAFTREFMTLAMRQLMSSSIGNNPPGEDAPEDFKKAYAEFTAKCKADKNYLSNLCTSLFRQLSGIGAAIEHVIAMSFKVGDLADGAFRASGALREVFRGERNFTSLVESRIHGYADGDINAELDDVNMVDSKELGTGAFNTVTLVKFKNGSEYVFKPEMPGRLGAGASPLQAGMDDGQQITRINGAVQKTADALGLGDVMVKTTAGTHNGTFGMFMEKAPGVTAVDFCAGKKDAESGKEVLDKNDIAKLSDADYGKVVGRTMRQCNRLQWFDAITGQGDRHGNNYMVEVGADLSVSVKGIDNDASFGVFRVGLRKFRITRQADVNRFNKAITEYSNLFKGNEDAVFNELVNDPGVVDDGEAITIDISQIKSPYLAHVVRQSLGAKTLAVPKEIDKDLYDKLVALRGGAARRNHLEELKSRLGADSEQYRAAVKRLDEAILYAMKLAEMGRVYSADQWETRDVQREVASRQPKMSEVTHLDGAVKQTSEKAVRYISSRVSYALSDNLYLRDLMKGMDRPGWLDGVN